MCECSRCWDNLEVNKRWAFHNTVPLRSCRMKQCKSASVRGLLCLNSQRPRNVFCYQNQRRNVYSGEMTDLFLTRQRMTHSASWMERSASSITSLLEPRTTMLTVFPGVLQPVICKEQRQNVYWKRHTTVAQIQRLTPEMFFYSGLQYFAIVSYLSWCVIDLKTSISSESSKISVQRPILIRTLISLPEPSRLTSSASSAVPSISGVKWSMWAMGLVPIVWRGDFVLLYRHTVGLFLKKY